MKPLYYLGLLLLACYVARAAGAIAFVWLHWGWR